MKTSPAGLTSGSTFKEARTNSDLDFLANLTLMKIGFTLWNEEEGHVTCHDLLMETQLS